MLDWTSLDNTSLSATDHFDNFYAKTTECVNSHIPKKKVTKKALKLRSKPWINSNMLSFLYVYSDHSILECYNLFSGVELSMRSFFFIQRLMHYRDKYFKSMTRNPSTTNKYLYRKFRNRTTKRENKIFPKLF